MTVIKNGNYCMKCPTVKKHIYQGIRFLEDGREYFQTTDGQRYQTNGLLDGVPTGKRLRIIVEEVS